LILDEAYINFVDESWLSAPLIKSNKVIILRSMTKDYGLAGLRLGYLLAGEDIIKTLRRVWPPWNVNIAAQKAGIAALEADEYLKQSLIRIRKAKHYLIYKLQRIGLAPLPSRANFFLFKVADGKTFRRRLLEEGILVRECTSFGLPDYIRIAPGTMTDCRKLISCIKRLYLRKG
jgi:histidinol-phosphate aminotransferase